MTGRPTFLTAMVVAGLLTACGVPHGDVDRHLVESRTCAAMRERAGREPFVVAPGRFAETLQQFRDSDRPYSTLQPFLRACRSPG